MNPRVSRVERPGSQGDRASRSPRSPPSWPSATRSTSCKNDITRETPACFEPTIDYVVTKVPRFDVREVPRRRRDADDADEVGRRDDGDRPDVQGVAAEGAARPGDRAASASAATARDLWGTPDQPTPEEIVAQAGHARTPSASGTSATPSRPGMTVEEVHQRTKIDPWFLQPHPRPRRDGGPAARRARRWRRPTSTCCWQAKQHGFSDRQLAHLWNTQRAEVRAAPQGARHRGRVQAGGYLRRRVRGVHAVLLLDLRDAACPQTVGERRRSLLDCRSRTRSGPLAGKPRIMILGGGPNRIGQGIEFDYCCCPGGVRPARRRVRDHHGQLEPGDRLAPTTTPATTCSSSR